MIALLGVVSLSAACGSDGGALRMGGAAGSGGGASGGGSAGTGGASSATDAQVEPSFVPPACVSGANEKRCAPSGFPFVKFAVANSDACLPSATSCPLPETAPPGDTTARLSQPEAGTLCFAGTVKPGGWALLVLNFPKVNIDRTRILETFDADALGITQAAFTITSPPSQGLRMSGGTTKVLECPSPDRCLISGFSLMTAPDSPVPVSIAMPGPWSAPFANFRQTDPTQGDPSQKFDTKALHFLAFDPGVGPYDFCVRDFRFLDANGDAVPER